MDARLSDLLIRGRAAARNGDASEARFFLTWVMDLCPGISPERLEGLYWLSRISANPAEKRACLEEILAAEPFNARARTDLAVLDGKLDPAARIDPDRYPVPEAGETRQLLDEEARRFTCPKCGGKLTYTPDGQSLTCESCDTKEQLGRTGRNQSRHEEDFLLSMATQRGHNRPVDMQAISCQGCGAEFILPPSDLTASCPFCGTPYTVNQVNIRAFIPPSRLIPFAISGREALRNLQEWLTRRRIQTDHTIPIPQGLYLPAWSFTVGGLLNWRGYRQQKSVKSLETGDAPVSEASMLVPAGTRLEDQFRQLVSTYNTNQCVPFDPRYLVDWPAETYQISMGDASLKARAMVLEKMRLELPRIQCQGIEDLQISSAGMIVESYELLLLPVWIARYIEDEQPSEVLINGQTGVVEGKAEGQNLLGWIGGLLG